MATIQVLGAGCPKCVNPAETAEAARAVLAKALMT